MIHLAFDWHQIIKGIGVRRHGHYRALEQGAFADLLYSLDSAPADPFGSLDTYMLWGAAAILGREQEQSEQALAYQARLNQKTKAITLFFWAQEAANHLQHMTAIGLLKPLMEQYPKDPELNNLMALCWQQLQDLKKGWHHVTEGLRHTPDHIGLNACRAQFYLAEGKMIEAEGAANYLLTLDHENTTAFNVLSRTAPKSMDDILLERFLKLTESGFMAASTCAGLMFDLGRIYDARGEYDQAFEAVAVANRFMENVPQRGPGGFDEAAEFAYFEARRSLFKSLPQMPAAAITPVFIVGLPRTGSTLLEQTLAVHPEVVAIGENAAVPTIIHETEALLKAGHTAQATSHVQQWRSAYLAKATNENPDARFLVDKTLGNSRHIGFLKKMFPNAKFLHARRDFMDTGLSIYFAPLLRTHTYATDLAAIAGFIALDEQIIKAWATDGHGALDVHYEEMVSDMEDTLQSVFAYIGLSWHQDCLNYHKKQRAVHTYSAHQVRKEVYQSSKGRWQNYANQLAPFQAALRERGLAA